MSELKSLSRAAFPAVAVETAEEERFTQYVVQELADKAVLTISATGGLKDVRNGSVVDPAAQYAKAFAYCARQENTVRVPRKITVKEG
jgi:hypothetical protein